MPLSQEQSRPGHWREETGQLAIPFLQAVMSHDTKKAERVRCLDMYWQIVSLGRAKVTAERLLWLPCSLLGQQSR